MSLLTKRKVTALILTTALALAACGSSGGIAIKDPWVRITGPNQPGAAYFVIENTTDKPDALLSASSPSYAEVQLHETVPMDPEASMAAESMDPMASPGGMDGDMGGMLGMQPVDEIAVPAGGSVALEPGGLHVMLMEPSTTVAIGDTVELTLTFRDAGEVKVSATVQGV